MKYLKYTLLLIILLTFVSVHADTCTYEEKQKLAEDIDLSKLKLTYVKGIIDEDGKYTGDGFVKAEMNLDENYYAQLNEDEYKRLISNNYFSYVAGGKYELEILSIQCNDETIIKTEVMLPHYNSKNKNVFDDGSKVIRTNTRVKLIVCTFILLLATIILVRRCIKYEKIS